MEVCMSKTRRGKYTDNRICYISKCKGDMRLYLRRKGKLPCFSYLVRGKSFSFYRGKIGIFGSVARNEQTEDSDVDVCVEMKKPDLFTMVHIKEELQELFGKPVDIVRLRKNMNPMLLKQIKRDGIYA